MEFAAENFWRIAKKINFN